METGGLEVDVPQPNLWRSRIWVFTAGVASVIAAILVTIVASAQGVSAGVVVLAYGTILVGAGVGVTELVSRYKDAPAPVLRSGPGLLYMALNAAASLTAFVLIRAMGWTFGIESGSNSTALLTTQFLVAAFGAAALFRSSLFTVRMGNQDIGVGPSAVLTTALSSTDRAVDRDRARLRGAEVVQVMQNVDFEKASINLVPYCFQVALQNVSTAEQMAVASLVNSLRQDQTGLSPRVKSMVLGAALMSIVGYDVLYWSVIRLCEEIRYPDVDECVPER
jgi:hypothetical protein